MTAEIRYLRSADDCPLTEKQARRRADAFVRSRASRLFEEMCNEWERDYFSLNRLNISWFLDERQRDGLRLKWDTADVRIAWVRDGEAYRELVAHVPPDDIPNGVALMGFVVETCDAFRHAGIEVEAQYTGDFTEFFLIFKRRMTRKSHAA